MVDVDRTLLVSVFVGLGVFLTLAAVNALFNQRRTNSRRIPIAVTVVAASAIMFGAGALILTGSATSAIGGALGGVVLALPMAAIVWFRMEDTPPVE